MTRSVQGSDGRHMSNSIEVLRAAWQASERRIYPLATTAPHQYEHAVRLARAVADALSGVTTTVDLLAAWDERSQIVGQGIAASGGGLGPVNETDIAGVAFALRHAEISALDLGETQRAHIRTARDRGDPWVTLAARGTLVHGLSDPYEAVEMHVASGIAIVSSVEPDLVTGAANYVLSVIELDPATATLVDIDPRIAPHVEVGSTEEYDIEHARLEQLVERRHSG